MGEDERDERGSSSSMMIFKGMPPSRDGRRGVKLRPRIVWRLIAKQENQLNKSK